MIKEIDMRGVSVRQNTRFDRLEPRISAKAIIVKRTVPATYKRINCKIEDLQDKRSIMTQAEIARRETRDKVQEIEKLIRGMNGVQEFEEGLFGMLVERIQILNMVQVEFILRAEVGVIDVIG